MGGVLPLPEDEHMCGMQHQELPLRCSEQSDSSADVLQP